MKQNFMLLLTALFSFTVANAQFSFGPSAGLNISKENYSNTAVYSTGSHNFFAAGAFAAYLTKKGVGVETGVFYSAEGTEESYKSGNSTITGVVTIKRINIPLLAQYHLKQGLYFETGPQIGFVTQAYGDYTSGHYDFKKGTQPTLTSWVIGAGYRLQKALPGLGINASYAKGLSHIQKGTVNAGTITGTTFSIKLFYVYTLKKKK